MQQLRLIDRFADLRYDENAGCSGELMFDNSPAQITGKIIVYLTDMTHRVFTCGGFQAHRAIRRYQAVDPVSTAYLSVIATFGACTCDSKI